MNKIATGLVFGAILGLLDGATAWFTPEARPMIVSILMGSSVKGLVVGLLSGWFARKVNSVMWGLVFGSVAGLFFAYLIAMQPQPSGNHYYLEIMLPGFVTGAIIGFLTQRAGGPSRQTT
jgi:ascorbate-specific PTS system EIIC-type component UlaA